MTENIDKATQIQNATNGKLTVFHDHRIAVLEHITGYDTHRLLPIKTDAFFIVLCLKGEINFYLNNKSYTAKANNLLICHPKTFIQNKNTSADFECFGFCLSQPYAKQLFMVSSYNWKLRFFIENHPILKVDDNGFKVFRQYFDLLRSKLKAQPHPHQKEVIDALLQAFVYEMHDSLDEAIKNEPNSFRSSTNLFYSFINLITSAYPKERSVSYYADKLFVSSKYLTTVCKEHTGDTALALITKYVVQDIEYLLHCPNKSIKQISNELEFPSLTFFGKYVKRNLGVSPKDYREQILKNKLF